MLITQTRELKLRGRGQSTSLCPNLANAHDSYCLIGAQASPLFSSSLGFNPRTKCPVPSLSPMSMVRRPYLRFKRSLIKPRQTRFRHPKCTWPNLSIYISAMTRSDPVRHPYLRFKRSLIEPRQTRLNTQSALLKNSFHILIRSVTRYTLLGPVFQLK